LFSPPGFGSPSASESGQFSSGVFIATRGGFALSSLANSNPPSQSLNFLCYRSDGFSDSSVPPSQSLNFLCYRSEGFLDSSVPPKSALLADSPSAEAASTGKRRIVGLIAGISGAAAMIAAVLGLAVWIRRRLARDRDSSNAGERSALVEDPETLLDGSDPLHGSRLGTADGMTMLGAHGSSRVMNSGPSLSANPIWELSDD
jgi:hypothetical protein